MNTSQRAPTRGRTARRFGLTILLVAITGWVVWTTHLAERLDLWLHGQQPFLFYLALDGDLLDDYSQVVSIAHNSGDNLTTTREALAHGAEVVEIDVVSVSGVLYAAHSTPPRFITRHIYQGLPLASIWTDASEAKAVKLDLKETSPRYVRLVLSFLATQTGTNDAPPVIVATRDRRTLETIHARAPEVILLQSIGSPAQFDALTGDPALVQLIDGVTIRHTLLNEERMTWLQEHDLLSFAWTVNELDRMNELVALGVDGITTDNLAIMELIGGDQDDETTLDERQVGD